MAGPARTPEQVRCEIIIPVYNGLVHLRHCVASVLTHTQAPYRLILADDGSDDTTARFVEEVAESHPHVQWSRSERNLGFVKNCNRAMEASSAEYVVLLNSDTMVTPNWLEKMLRCGDSDPKIAAASPLANECPHMNLPMLPGFSLLEMAELVQSLSDHVYPDVTTCEGFCLLLPRRARDELGLFDEIYSPGYGEESDYCMRAVSRGWRTVAVDDTYIYHRGRGTFGEKRKELYERNSQIFHSRWNELYRRDFEDFKRRKPIDYLRRRIGQLRNPNWFPFEAPPPPLPKKPGRRARLRNATAWLPKVTVNSTRKPEPTVSATLTVPTSQPVAAAKSLGRALWDLPAAKRRRAALRGLGQRQETLSVAFLLPCIQGYGGVIVAANVANELLVRGANVKLFNISVYNEFDHQLYTAPASFRKRGDAADHFPEVDIAVATQWETVEYIAQVVERRPRTKAFYFVQDYEAFFIPEEETEQRRKAIATYSMIPRKVVMSEFLREAVGPHDPTVFKVSPAVDLDTFYPRPVDSAARSKRVLAMVRPHTPWRGFDTLCRAFEIVGRERPDTELVVYGTDDLSESGPSMRFRYTNLGLLPQRQLPQVYSSCGVYCDFSHFHGLGLTSLEAMACGCACVMTDSGGPSEYAIDGWNALVRPPGDAEGLARAIIALLEGGELRRYVAGNGFLTASRCSQRKTAEQLLGLFERALANEI